MPMFGEMASPASAAAAVQVDVQQMQGARTRETSIEYPPPDWCSDRPLVAPHFETTPALTAIDTVYSKYGNAHQRERWRGFSQDAKLLCWGAMNCRNITHQGHEYGLYIAGSESDVNDPDRDRVMLLVIELRADEIERWKDLHPGVLRFLNDTLRLGGDAGVCVRYYKKSEPIANAFFDRVDPNETALARGERLSGTWLETVLRTRAHEEARRRATGTYETESHIQGTSEDVQEATRVLASLAMWEEVQVVTNEPVAWQRALAPNHSSSGARQADLVAAPIPRAAPDVDQIYEGLFTIIDYYNSFANPLQRRNQARDDDTLSYSDNGTEGGVAGSATEDDDESDWDESEWEPVEFSDMLVNGDHIIVRKRRHRRW